MVEVYLSLTWKSLPDKLDSHKRLPKLHIATRTIDYDLHAIQGHVNVGGVRIP